MPEIKKYLFYCVLIACVACSRAKEVPIIPIDDFFAQPQKTNYQISPNGEKISYLKSHDDQVNLYVDTPDGKNPVQITNDSARKIIGYFWISSEELLYVKSEPGNKGQNLFAISSNGKNWRELLSQNHAKIRFITSGATMDHEILLALNTRDSTVFDAYRLNTATGNIKLVVRNPGNITKWYADAEGELRMAIASDGVNETLLYREKESDNFFQVMTNNFKTSILPVGFSNSKGRIYALSNQNRDKMALVELDCKTGREFQTIYSHPEVDISEATYSKKLGRLTFAGFESWKKHRYFLDNGVKDIYRKLDELLPDTEFRVTSTDTAERKFIIRTQTDRNPGSYFIYTPSDNELVKLSDINASLNPSQLAKMEAVSFKTRDNILVNGYITLPVGKNPKNLPVVVIPHSGPSSRVTWGYNSEVQFLANRGYAVLQVNFRGSTGYGKEFWIAGFKEWGKKMQDDVTDGVKWLISQEIADSSRIAIYGSSFGGFAALNGICFQPELYRCAASYSGITNLFTYLKDIPPYYRPYLQMFYEMVGNPAEDADYFREVSPIFHADKIKSPILIAQGTKDPRANMNETNQFVKELKMRKVPVTYLLKEGEGHYFKNPKNKLEFYSELEKFLAKNLSKE